MANKILSVSILEDNIDILKLELGVTNAYTVVEKAQFDVDQQTLDRAAQWADEIRINADFPSAEYHWGIFPKVNNRILKQLVNRQGVQALETRQGARVVFQDQGTTIEDAVIRRKVSYLAVREEDVATLERNLFARHRKKIRRVTSLPVALSAVVVQSDHPNKDFMVAWIGETSTIFVISSPQGDVKIARNIPLGLNCNDLAEEEFHVLESFAQEFDRDVMTTLLLYNDTFEEPNCEKFYMLGNAKLKGVLEQYPLQSAGGHEVFSLDNLSVRGLKNNGIGTYHLLGNLFPGRGYNLVDQVILWRQRFDRGYKYASMLLLGCIAATAVWMQLTTPFESSEKGDIYAAKVRELEEINSRLYQLQSKEIELKRFSGWKDFYKNTYTNQPAWSKMFSSLANDIPGEFVINSLEIFPGKNTGIHGWSCILSGKIKATQWNHGLALLREFGTKVHQSLHYDIIDVQYTPLEDDKNSGLQKTSFDFVIKMKLSPQENK